MVPCVSQFLFVLYEVDIVVVFHKLEYSTIGFHFKSSKLSLAFERLFYFSISNSHTVSSHPCGTFQIPPPPPPPPANLMSNPLSAPNAATFASASKVLPPLLLEFPYPIHLISFQPATEGSNSTASNLPAPNAGRMNLLAEIRNGHKLRKVREVL